MSHNYQQHKYGRWNKNKRHTGSTNARGAAKANKDNSGGHGYARYGNPNTRHSTQNEESSRIYPHDYKGQKHSHDDSPKYAENKNRPLMQQPCNTVDHFDSALHANVRQVSRRSYESKGEIIPEPCFPHRYDMEQRFHVVSCNFGPQQHSNFEPIHETHWPVATPSEVSAIQAYNYPHEETGAYSSHRNFSAEFAQLKKAHSKQTPSSSKRLPPSILYSRCSWDEYLKFYEPIVHLHYYEE